MTRDHYLTIRRCPTHAEWSISIDDEIGCHRLIVSQPHQGCGMWITVKHFAVDSAKLREIVNELECIAEQMEDEVTETVTDKQLHILRHALGWPKNYRNRFTPGDGSDDYADCEALAKAGLMYRSNRSNGPVIYHVTGTGKEAAQ